jgi:hypothetical protein
MLPTQGFKEKVAHNLYDTSLLRGGVVLMLKEKLTHLPYSLHIFDKKGSISDIIKLWIITFLLSLLCGRS